MMPSVDTIVQVSIAGVALSLSPGPSMFYVLSRTIGQSRAAGLASAIGLCLGGVALAVLAALGLTAFLQSSPWAVRVLTFAGAGYLIYLGVTLIMETHKNLRANFELEPVDQRSFMQIMGQGVLVEILNPKTILFFALFISPFVDFTADDITEQALILGILVPLTAIPSDLTVVYLGSRAMRFAQDNTKLQITLSLLAGIVLIGIGLTFFL